MRSVMDTVRRVAKATGSEQLRAQAEALDSQMTREAEVEAHDAQTRSSWYPQTASSAAILNAPLAWSDAEALAESLRVAADAAAADARTRTHIESKKARGQNGGEAKSLRERLRSITDSVAKLRGDDGRGESARRRGGREDFYRATTTKTTGRPMRDQRRRRRQRARGWTFEGWTRRSGRRCRGRVRGRRAAPRASSARPSSASSVRAHLQAGHPRRLAPGPFQPSVTFERHVRAFSGGTGGRTRERHDGRVVVEARQQGGTKSHQSQRVRGRRRRGLQRSGGL